MAILTVSRQLGSGGREIAEGVAESLGYEYLDTEEILLHIKEAGGDVEAGGELLDERSPTLWGRYDRSFKASVAMFQAVILEHALRDRVVVMGRGGNFLLKGVPHALRIRIVAPLESRIERISRRERVDRETAAWLVENTDRDRERFVFYVYGTHQGVPEDYDVIINASEGSMDNIISRLRDALVGRDRLFSDNARRIIELRAAAARLKAGLYRNPSFLLPTLDVESDGSAIVLKGIVHNPKEHQQVEEEARRLTEGYPLKFSLHYRL